jgi:hypothetical protein
VALQPWDLSGTVRKVLDLKQMELHLGKHSERRQPIPSGRTRVRALVPVRSITAETPLTEFRVQVNRADDDPLEHEIVIVPKGVLSIGRFGFKITLEAELQTGQKVRRAITASGEVASDIQATPPQVHLGAKARYEVAQEFVSLYSLTGSKFKITQHRVDDHGLSIRQIDDKTDGKQFLLSQQIDRLWPAPQKLIQLIW